MANSTPLPVNQDEHRQRWFNTLRTMSRYNLGFSLGTTPFAVLFTYLTRQDLTIPIVGILLLAAMGGAGSLLLMRVSKPGWLEAATWINLICQLGAVFLASLLVGAGSGVMAFFFWPPFLAAVLSTGLRNIIVAVVLSVVAMVTTLELHATAIVKPTFSVEAELPQVNVMLWIFALGLVISGLFMFVSQIRKVLEESNSRTNEMTELTEQLRSIAQAGSQLSALASNLSIDLTATSNQQASGASQQSSAVLEATTSLEELGQSAAQIATNASQVTEAADKALEMAHMVKQVSEEAEQATEKGRTMIEESIIRFEQVRHSIENLGQRLLMLTERSKQISSILELLNSIADETHLLALNAAIESAGAGANGTRFSVVSNEIKNLADRSIEATKEVRMVINELQGAVAAAVLAAEEGKKEATRAVEKSYQTGLMFDEVGEVVKQTSLSGGGIVENTELVSQLASEISLATRQQLSASEQIIVTIHSIKDVAQETANGSLQVASSAKKLTELTFELKNTLSQDKVV